MVSKVNGAAYSGVWVEKQVTFVKVIFNVDISALPAASLYELGTTTAPSSGTVASSTFGVVESAIVQSLKIMETNATVLGVSGYNVLSSTATSGSSSGTTVTVASTAGLYVGETVTVTGGTGTFAAGTTIVSITSSTTFVVSAAPSVALSGATITATGACVDVMLGYADSWFSDQYGTIATGLTFTFAEAVITVAGSAAADAVGVLVNVNPAAVSYALAFANFNGTMPVSTLANGALENGPGATSGATPPNSSSGTQGYYPVDPYTA